MPKTPDQEYAWETRRNALVRLVAAGRRALDRDAELDPLEDLALRALIHTPVRPGPIMQLAFAGGMMTGVSSTASLADRPLRSELSTALFMASEICRHPGAVTSEIADQVETASQMLETMKVKKRRAPEEDVMEEDLIDG